MPATYDVMWMLTLFVPLVLVAVGAFALYWVVRRAVRDGIVDARQAERRVLAPQQPGWPTAAPQAGVPGGPPAPGPQAPAPQAPAPQQPRPDTQGPDVIGD